MIETEMFASLVINTRIMCNTTIQFESAKTFGGFQFKVTTINRDVDMGRGGYTWQTSKK